MYNLGFGIAVPGDIDVLPPMKRRSTLCTLSIKDDNSTRKNFQQITTKNFDEIQMEVEPLGLVFLCTKAFIYKDGRKTAEEERPC